MKKLWIGIAVVVLLAGGGVGYYFWKRAPAEADKAGQPQTPSVAKVERGMIRLTVNSTGRVVSNLDVDIKCKASGAIVKLPFDVSDPVNKGDTLLELDPVDQQRILTQEEASLAAAEARLAISRLNLQVAERTLATDLQRARAALKAAEVRGQDSRAKADRLKQLLDKKLASQEEYDTAETAATQAASDLEGARIRLEELKTQEAALDLRRQEVKQTEAQVELNKVARSVALDRLADTRVTAPMDGVVAVRNVQAGQIISSAVSNVGGGTTVLTLSDLSRVFVLASVDESDIGKVQLGQPAQITADAFAGQKFRGKVVRIATRGVNASNVVTFEVKIEVTSENKSKLKPEMTANVEVVGQEKRDVLTVPVEAITRKTGKFFATVAKGQDAKEERGVEVGISDGVKSEIISGLEEGETVTLRKTVSDSRWSGGQRRPEGGMMLPFGGGRGRR